LQHNPQFFRQALGPADQTTETLGQTGDTSSPPTGEGAEVRREPEATKAARKRAEELGVDLSGLEGSGSGGRIMVRDVTQAAREYNQGEKKE
jgi:pyruvate/2-oxoglutarate dehydrogenase complex dihydrolipoamide acyltransferase (E2) component